MFLASVGDRMGHSGPQWSQFEVSLLWLMGKLVRSDRLTDRRLLDFYGWSTVYVMCCGRE